jgi:hypothetical protein
MAILYVGIDLAKNVFAIHGVDERGKAVLVRPSVSRGKLHELIAALGPCTIGMEACSGAHHWARLFMQHGHKGAADGAQVRRTLSDERQAGQERAGQVVRAPGAPRPGRAAHRDYQVIAADVTLPAQATT